MFARVVFSVLTCILLLPYPAHAREYREAHFAAQKKMVTLATKALKAPYVLGAAGPNAFDCSGLIQWVYGHIGVRVPRTAREQADAGKAVRDRLSLGDVIVFKRADGGLHTGLYLAKGRFVHAEGKKTGVRISSLFDPFWRKRFIQAKRMLPTP